MLTELDTTLDEEILGRLHARLVAEAGEELDIGYRTVDSPLGALLLAGTARGLLRVGFASSGEAELLQELATKVSPRILRAPGRVDRVATELEEYFAGTRRAFDVPLDLRLVGGFRLAVINHLSHIDYGKTASYATLARAVGSPHAVRAVGTACARNPLPLVLPCHRVVRSDGSLGQYAGGVEAKRILLELESVV